MSSIYGDFPIRLVENEDFGTYTFTLYASPNGAAVDLTDYTCAWMFRINVGDAGTVGSYSPTLGGTSGTVSLALTASQVSTLVAALSYAGGYHDILLTSGAGVKSHLIGPQSKVTSIRSVTR